MDSYKNRVSRHKWLMALPLLIGMLFSTPHTEAQVRKDFTQRTSSDSPDTKIYNIKGDFTMIGNTNLTLSSYSDNGSNNANMRYVDVDGDNNTSNSSSATLGFSTEGGADPSCSSIIYAGLYWTGRAHNGNSPMTFYNGGSTNNRYTGDSFNNYSLSISADNQDQGSGTSNGRRATYTFERSGANTVTFRFNSWRIGNSGSNYSGSVEVQVGSGNWTTVSGSITSNNDNDFTFTFATPYAITSGGQTIYINSLRKKRTDNNVNDFSSSWINSYDYRYRVSVTSGTTKLFNKRQVKLKKAGGTYQTVTAGTDDIYYPTNSDGYMYSAYAEVTEYVKENGVGEYFVADIALQEGNGGSTGFYGGWGMIVVYENSKMKWRDVTVFDGHAYVAGSTTAEYELPVSGFNTVQTGPVGVKLGLMAGEGDVSVTGDEFKIRNAANNAWVNLSHGGNSTGNFFNSSIYTGGNARNPNLQNNTGLDISMFTLNNTNNTLMTNNQTSTRFQYNSRQDTYIIFCIAMAVDAYIPEVQSENNVIYINDEPFIKGTTDPIVVPNDEIQYTVSLRNLGSEAVKDGKIVIPIPFTTSYVSSSTNYLWTGTPAMSGNPPTFDPTLGATGSIVWDIGYIPLPTDKSEVLAKLTYRLKVTDDCFILNNSACAKVSVDGVTTGTGVTSGVSFTNNKFVTDFIQDGTCAGEPVYVPTEFTIDADAFLTTDCTIPPGEDSDYYTRRKFKYCGIAAGGSIPFSDVSPNFPKGSRFYSAVDKDENDFIIPAAGATQYTSTTGFPVNFDEKGVTYFAIPPGLDVTCYWEFIIIVDEYCDNYWHGTESTDWAVENNWTAKKVPLPGEKVEFATTENYRTAAQRDLHLDQDRIIGDLINGSEKNLVIPVGGNQLTINGTVTDTNTDKGTIVVKADPENKKTGGTLLFADPAKNKNVQATVEFYNQAYDCADCGFFRRSWQYFGIPVVSGTLPAGDVTGDETVNLWTEPYNGDKWRPVSGALDAFKGYQITNSTTSQPEQVYSFKGILNVGDATVGLTKTTNVNYSGTNLVGNSYTAAIPISADALKFSDDNIEQSVYLFNTGTRDQWRKLNGGNTDGIASGQYLNVPFHLAGQNDDLPSMIPSMHAFMILAESSATLSIDYTKLVKNELVESNGETVAMRSAPASTGNTATVQPLPSIKMDVIGEQSADRVWIFAKEGSTRGFDNGWDGRKMAESGIAQLYVMDDTGNDRFQVATVPGLDNVTLGFVADVDGKYTIEFALSDHWTTEEIWLHDLATGDQVRLAKSVSYTFEAKRGDAGLRFRLSTSGSNIPVDEEAAKIVVNATDEGAIVISNSSSNDCSVSISNTAGRILQKLEVKARSEAVAENLSRGTYIVRLQNAVINDARKIIVR